MIKEFIQSNNTYFISELRRSIKNIEIEERMDLAIHRPIGLILSWIAIKMGCAPIYISLASLATGVGGGILFYWQDDFQKLLWASALIILAGLLDSADGQVARLTGNFTKLGRIIDGVADNIVFITIYISGSLFFLPYYGIWMIPVLVVSGVLHSTKTLLFDYYKNECSYYYGLEDDYRNQSNNEIKAKLQNASSLWEKVLYIIYLNYVRQQNLLITRKGATKEGFEELRANRKITRDFREAYRNTFGPYLTFWALFGGSNTHRTLIIIFGLFGHFDYYLIVNILLTLPLLLISKMQSRKDQEFLNTFSLE